MNICVFALLFAFSSLATLVSCDSIDDTGSKNVPSAALPQEGRLGARPTLVAQQCSPGEMKLGLGAERDGILFVPELARERDKLPVVVLLHGAGGRARSVIGIMRSQATEHGFILVVLDSRQQTWDIVLGSYGPDVEFINEALKKTFEQCSVDGNRVAIGGFSDGASYALSLGLTNGDLFTHVMAFSPGFMQPAKRFGKPRIFVSHGKRDPVLPFDNAQRIVRNLQDLGNEVRFLHFEGGHEVPQKMVNEAVEWFKN